MVQHWQTNPQLIEGMAEMNTVEISIRSIEPYNQKVIPNMSQVLGDAMKNLRL
jgi:hypothetical protein